MKTRNTKGFTLVEIMIVVVIIGLLAAMAIPAFQKVRSSSLEKTVLNDARQIGSAAQQYFLENGANAVTFSISNGAVSGPLTDYVKTVSKNVSFVGSPAGQISSSDTFTLQLKGAFADLPKQFDSEGKLQ